MRKENGSSGIYTTFPLFCHEVVLIVQPRTWDLLFSTVTYVKLSIRAYYTILHSILLSSSPVDIKSENSKAKTVVFLFIIIIINSSPLHHTPSCTASWPETCRHVPTNLYHHQNTFSAHDSTVFKKDVIHYDKGRANMSSNIKLLLNIP